MKTETLSNIEEIILRYLRLKDEKGYAYPTHQIYRNIRHFPNAPVDLSYKKTINACQSLMAKSFVYQGKTETNPDTFYAITKEGREFAEKHFPLFEVMADPQPSENCKRALEFISKAEEITPQNERERFRRSECIKHAINALKVELKETANESY